MPILDNGPIGRAYNCWRNIHARCYNKKNPGYKNYGRRGITVCDRWFSFDNFLADMGGQPEGLSIERADNDKGYCPKNCYWATQEEQDANKRSNTYIVYMGERKTVAQWARELGLTADYIYKRLKRNMPIELALKPPKRYKK